MLLLHGIVVLHLAFQFRRILEKYFQQVGLQNEFSRIFTFLFGPFYIPRRINRGI